VVTVSTHGVMVMYIKVIFLMISDMGMAKCIGMMVPTIKVFGIKGIKAEKGKL
jgi:hypothetical protein